MGNSHGIDSIDNSHGRYRCNSCKTKWVFGCNHCFKSVSADHIIISPIILVKSL